MHASRENRWTYIASPIRASDGDTIWVWLDKGDRDYTEQDIRVQYVDTDELNDPDPVKRDRAQKAKAFTEAWLAEAAEYGQTYGKTKADRERPLTIVTWYDRKSYNRLVGVVENLRGERLDEALVAAGLGAPTDALGKRDPTFVYPADVAHAAPIDERGKRT